MNQTRSMGEGLSVAAEAIIDRVVAYLPSVLAALLLLLLGWLVALVLRAATVRAVRLTDSVLAKVTRSAGASPVPLVRSAAVLGGVAFWVAMLFFVTAATWVLGLHSFTQWLTGLLDHLPTIAVGAFILVGGYFLSRFLAEVARATATRLAPAPLEALGHIVQASVLAAAALVGAEQIGIRVTFLVIFVAAVLAAGIGAVTLAVGGGARDYVANLIGAHDLRQAFEVGQRVRVAEIEGRILQVTATALVLETGEGRASLPARLVHQQSIVLLTGARDG